jgi:hypothetical protein
LPNKASPAAKLLRLEDGRVDWIHIGAMAALGACAGAFLGQGPPLDLTYSLLLWAGLGIPGAVLLRIRGDEEPLYQSLAGGMTAVALANLLEMGIRWHTAAVHGHPTMLEYDAIRAIALSIMLRGAVVGIMHGLLSQGLLSLTRYFDYRLRRDNRRAASRTR